MNELIQLSQLFSNTKYKIQNNTIKYKNKIQRERGREIMNERSYLASSAILKYKM